MASPSWPPCTATRSGCGTSRPSTSTEASNGSAGRSASWSRSSRSPRRRRTRRSDGFTGPSTSGKPVVVVKKDVPGFITTRVLGPYFERAAWIHEREGIPIETIDAAMRFRAGFPMGPFELADQVGVDVLHHLIVNAHRPMPPSVQDLIDRKKVGHKVGEGFYAYREGRPKLTPEMGQAFDPIRILAPMVNEAAELVALDVASPSEIDEAMRLGTAFPKGPLATADDLGID